MKKILVAVATIVCTFVLNAQENNRTNSCNDTIKIRCNTSNTCFEIRNLHHFTISLGYGFSLSNDHDATLINYKSNSNHNSSMRHGIDYRFDYDYDFQKNMMFGAIFNMYNSFDSYYINSKSVGSSSDDRWVFYVGPSFGIHTDVVKEHYTFFAKATAGFINFRNAQRTLVSSTGPTGVITDQIISTTYKKFTLGYGVFVGMSYYCNQYFSIDGMIGYLGGNINKLKTTDTSIDLNKSENLSRLNINVGIKVKL